MSAGQSQWLFTKEELDNNSPSRRDGISFEAENEMRLETCAWMQECGQALRLPQLTIATAVVFFLRFFARKSMVAYDRFIVAITALFLGGKVEESMKKLDDVLKSVIKVMRKAEGKPEADIDTKSPDFLEKREKILVCERLMLGVLNFDLAIQHPYKCMVQNAKKISADRMLAQTSWNFINDSLKTTLCLQFRPELIASAAIYLGSKFLGFELPKDGNKPWWEIFDANLQDIECIAEQILDLYNVDDPKNLPTKNGTPSMPTKIPKPGNKWPASSPPIVRPPLPPGKAPSSQNQKDAHNPGEARPPAPDTRDSARPSQPPPPQGNKRKASGSEVPPAKRHNTGLPDNATDDRRNVRDHPLNSDAPVPMKSEQLPQNSSRYSPQPHSPSRHYSPQPYSPGRDNFQRDDWRRDDRSRRSVDRERDSRYRDRYRDSPRRYRR